MPLLDLQKQSPDTVAKFTIKQVVSFAGDGTLRDESECSSELRAFLRQISSQKLEEYVADCLSEAFDKSGLVLQDLINEVGRRLDCQVINGLYAGRRNKVGYDGLWHTPEGRALIVEVKTTDAYRISMDTIARYRNRLIEDSQIGEKSSILIVVGREDTGELEAQVRGSRHAWDIRLISAEALLKMMRLKENSDEQETGQKLREVLSPVEYTRVDALVDVIFTTATDLEADLQVENDEEETIVSKTTKRTIDLTDAKILRRKREQIISSLAGKFELKLITRSRATFWSADRSDRVVCSISKRYDDGPGYWYAYHPKWRSFLRDGARGYFVLGCMGRPDCFAIPAEVMEPFLPRLNKTGTDEKAYWHIHLSESREGEIYLAVPKEENFKLSEFSVPLVKEETES